MAAAPDPGLPGEEPYLDDGTIRRALNVVAGAIAIVVVAAVTWSVLTPVDEIAKAPGAIAPSGQVQVVDARDGGLIREVLVREGTRVEKGAPILVFDRVRPQSELATAAARKVALELEIERLTAFIDDRAPDFSRVAMDYPALVARETAALAAQRNLLDADILVIQQQMVAKKAQLAALDAQVPAFEQEVAAVAKAHDIVEGLTAKGLGSQLRLAELIEQKARINRALTEARGQRTVLEGQVAELELAVVSRRKKASAEAAEKRVETGAQFRTVTEQIAELRDRVDSATVVAPVSGLVQSLPNPRAGQVVAPGEVVAEIVPSDEGLLFEARLSPRDIGFVVAGQPAKVKVDAYDFSRYGALDGVVDSVSATTIADPRGAPYYRLRIRLEKLAFRDDRNLAVQAGMTGEADVRTGRKTVFQYLWKPIYTNLDLALTER
ncbi:MAG: HlyD family type I secretion periplasmic adaptor subunit [Proteobacteria bacterium]|nr:HlyD family type I secretion periplasmic adaptor subunit [Pseudomonadota bacterium]